MEIHGTQRHCTLADNIKLSLVARGHSRDSPAPKSFSHTRPLGLRLHRTSSRRISTDTLQQKELSMAERCKITAHVYLLQLRAVFSTSRLRAFQSGWKRVSCHRNTHAMWTFRFSLTQRSSTLST